MQPDQIDRLAKRYQNQRLPVRVYRWLRWRPLYAIKGCMAIAAWAIRGAKLPEPVTFEDGRVVQFHPTRRSFMQHIWQYHRSLAGMEMEYWFTIEECIADAERRRP